MLVSSQDLLCAQKYCQVMGLLVPLEDPLNGTSDILGICVLLILWQQFGVDPSMSVMVRFQNAVGQKV